MYGLGHDRHSVTRLIRSGAVCPRWPIFRYSIRGDICHALLSLPGGDLAVAHYRPVPTTASSGRPPLVGWLCLIIGVALLVATVVSSAWFVRSTVERNRYVSAARCLDKPVGDCWVEVRATVVGKRVDERSVLVDDHVLELDTVGGLEVTLADGSGLWSALAPGERVTLRYWQGDVVYASAEGHEADTVKSPRVGTQRLYAGALVSLGLGGLLIVTGFGWLGVGRHRRPGQGRLRAALRWAGRCAVSACVMGAVGLAAEIYTRAAPLPVVTLLGVGALLAVAGGLRLARARFVRHHVAA